MELLNEDGFRCDGRRANELRQVRLRLGVLANASGSAYVEQGLTKVLVAVYGPQECVVGKGKVLHDRATIKCDLNIAPFSSGERPPASRNDRKIQEWSLQLKRCFERVINVSLYPHSLIQICYDVIQSDGSELSACVNAASMALLNAGVSMVDVVTSTTCAFGKGEFVLDVCGNEESMHGVSILILALTNRKKQIALMESQYAIHTDSTKAIYDLAKEGCCQAYDILQPIVRDYMARLISSINIQTA